MTRRADPERIYQARRAATFAILTQARAIDQLDAAHWMARWEREAERQGLDRFSADFWAAGRDWIAENRRKHQRSPDACYRRKSRTADARRAPERITAVGACR